MPEISDSTEPFIHTSYVFFLLPFNRISIHDVDDNGSPQIPFYLLSANCYGFLEKAIDLSLSHNSFEFRVFSSKLAATRDYRRISTLIFNL